MWVNYRRLAVGLRRPDGVPTRKLYSRAFR
jgi:hypothetical protein